MLRDLGKALSAAIADSSEAHDALRRLHDEGYSLLILLNRRDEPEEGDEASVTAGGKDAQRADGADAVPARDGDRGPRTGRPEPIFRIDGRDLAFLRSIGIDPTRRIRRRRA